MQVVTIHDAKTNLSKYIASAKRGDEIFIGGFGKPEVKLVKIIAADLDRSMTRDFTFSQNKIVEQDDSFSADTNKMVSDLMLGTDD